MKTWPIIFSTEEIVRLEHGGYGMTSRLINGQWRNLKARQDKGELCILWVKETATYEIVNARGSRLRNSAPIYYADGHGWETEPVWQRSIYMPRDASRFTLMVTRAEHVKGKTVIWFRCYKENIDKFIKNRRFG